MSQLIECIPNFSEGRDQKIIHRITDEISSVEGIKLLNVESGYAANRTIVTFAGKPSAVCEAAFKAVKMAAQLIDMTQHKGVHPRIGAIDVLPLVPLACIKMEEVVKLALNLAERIGTELEIPVYCYGNAAISEKHQTLAECRKGEYEGLSQKIKSPDWKPDFGPAEFTPKIAKSGAIIVGARKILIAFNVNLDTTNVEIAKEIAKKMRGKGNSGLLQSVKVIGWYIEEYGFAQVSCNLTDYSINSMHQVFESVSKLAREVGVKVTGSELIGLVPLQAMVESGRYFLKKEKQNTNVTEEEIIKEAVSGLGLDQLNPFNPEEKIIEYRMGGLTQLTNSFQLL